MPRSDQTAFVFEVLEGPAAGAVVELAGREMPFRAAAGGSISFGKTLRTKLTWYPGNRVASQQIVGPILKPTTINGLWQERYLGEDRPIELAELFEELLETGVQVRVRWQTVERIGVVKDFEYFPGDPTGGLTDLRWQMVLEWSHPGGQAARQVVGSADQSLRDGTVTAVELLIELGESLSRFLDRVGTFVGLAKVLFQSSRTSIKDLFGDLGQPIESLSSTAARMGSEVEVPARLVEEASTAAGAAQAAAGRAQDVVAGIFPAEVVVSDNLEDQLLGAIERYDLIDRAREAMESAFEQRVRYEGIARPDEFARVQPVLGSDLRAVALEFYGDGALWTRIAGANGIETSLIPDDVEEIVVPLSLPDALDPRC